MSATFFNMRRRMAAAKAKEEKIVENFVEKVENTPEKPAEKPKKGKVKKDGE